MDFESFRKAGVSLGSGALLVCDDSTCVVDLAKVLLQFFRFESCGKCTPCRIGTQRCYEILAGITEGRGQLPELDRLLELAMKWNALLTAAWADGGSARARYLKALPRRSGSPYPPGVCPTGVCAMLPQAAEQRVAV